MTMKNVEDWRYSEGELRKPLRAYGPVISLFIPCNKAAFRRVGGFWISQVRKWHAEPSRQFALSSCVAMMIMVHQTRMAEAMLWIRTRYAHWLGQKFIPVTDSDQLCPTSHRLPPLYLPLIREIFTTFYMFFGFSVARRSSNRTRWPNTWIAQWLTRISYTQRSCSERERTTLGSAHSAQNL